MASASQLPPALAQRLAKRGILQAREGEERSAYVCVYVCVCVVERERRDNREENALSFFVSLTVVSFCLFLLLTVTLC